MSRGRFATFPVLRTNDCALPTIGGMASTGEVWKLGHRPALDGTRGTAMTVPANSSRFMRSAADARRQPLGVVELAWRDDDPYLFNAAFDAELIAHDESYCTSVVDLHQVVQVPTMGYFPTEVLPHAVSGARVLDIGCGQGEFVNRARAYGIDAIGYDPALRSETEHLHGRYWSPDDEPADIFVMRCVLPHIPDPWRFLDQLGQANPGALVLVEFQRLEWILDEGIWYQLSHDHVNVFSVADFSARFDVVANGVFSNGEWAWVLLRADTYRDPTPRPCDVTDDLSRLLKGRARTLEITAELDRPVAVWGAAGKGIVLAHALLEAGAHVVAAVDADPLRQGLFMEVSGLPIYSPTVAQVKVPDDALLLVCNPNHFAAIQAARPPWELKVPSGD